jgi:hypothetical protein
LGSDLGKGKIAFRFFLRLITENMIKTTATPATLSPIRRVVAKLENSESSVCETMIVTLATMGLAVYVPELLLYCQVAVPLMLWFPIVALVGMRTAVSIILFVLAVRLNGKLEVTWRVPLVQKSDANEILVTRTVN